MSTDLVLTGDLGFEAVGEIAERSRQLERSERLSTRMGCHNVKERIQRLTRSSPQAAKQLERAAKATAPAWDPITGNGMPAVLPAMRETMLDGEAGIDGVLAVPGPLLAMGDRAARDKVLAADEVLAAAARGEGPDAAPPACADLLRLQASTSPRERSRRRGVRRRRGRVPPPTPVGSVPDDCSCFVDGDGRSVDIAKLVGHRGVPSMPRSW
ncbi:MAG TPA: hypothetical protein VFN24_00065 [Microbacterium sp.]|nr:hypothetical protein [Microbacterium sp.]